jgi:hypothetical protein
LSLAESKDSERARELARELRRAIVEILNSWNGEQRLENSGLSAKKATRTHLKERKSPLQVLPSFCVVLPFKAISRVMGSIDTKGPRVRVSAPGQHLKPKP